MRTLLVAAFAFALAPAALAGGPRMELGSVLDEAVQPTQAAAAQRVAPSRARTTRSRPSRRGSR